MSASVEVEVEDSVEEEPPRSGRAPRPEASSARVEVEREVTKRHLIEAVTSVVVVVLYMAFSLLRDRDRGVVVVDGGPEDDWVE
ncbi:MAG: hypothetical protein JXX28_00110 [Deltaproteobacteria bacterium]|nr:hypothetical protein [Deltaproteobacteria bacterium]